MAINFIEEPTINITRSEMQRLMPEYRRSQQYTTAPVSFESWYRNRQEIKIIVEEIFT